MKSCVVLTIFSTILLEISCYSYIRPHSQFMMYTTTQPPDTETTTISPNQDTFENQQNWASPPRTINNNRLMIITDPVTNTRFSMSFEELMRIISSKRKIQSGPWPQGMKADSLSRKKALKPDQHDIDNVDEIWAAITSEQNEKFRRPLKVPEQFKSLRNDNFWRTNTNLPPMFLPPSINIFVVFSGQEGIGQPNVNINENPIGNPENYESSTFKGGNQRNNADDEQELGLDWSFPSRQSKTPHRVQIPILPKTTPNVQPDSNNSVSDNA